MFDRKDNIDGSKYSSGVIHGKVDANCKNGGRHYWIPSYGDTTQIRFNWGFDPVITFTPLFPKDLHWLMLVDSNVDSDPYAVDIDQKKSSPRSISGRIVKLNYFCKNTAREFLLKYAGR